MKNIDDIIGKIFEKVEPEAISYVTTQRRVDAFYSGLGVVFFGILLIACLAFGLDTMLEDAGRYGPTGLQVTLWIVSAVLIVVETIMACTLVSDLCIFYIHSQNPKADAMKYWINQIT